eukprot:5677685-Pyramimonas_sp.AAC.1
MTATREGQRGRAGVLPCPVDPRRSPVPALLAHGPQEGLGRRQDHAVLARPRGRSCAGSQPPQPAGALRLRAGEEHHGPPREGGVVNARELDARDAPAWARVGCTYWPDAIPGIGPPHGQARRPWPSARASAYPADGPPYDPRVNPAARASCPLTVQRRQWAGSAVARLGALEHCRNAPAFPNLAKHPPRPGRPGRQGEVGEDHQGHDEGARADRRSLSPRAAPSFWRPSCSAPRSSTLGPLEGAPRGDAAQRVLLGQGRGLLAREPAAALALDVARGP